MLQAVFDSTLTSIRFSLWYASKGGPEVDELFRSIESVIALAQEFCREQLNGLFQQIRFGAAGSGNQRG